LVLVLVPERGAVHPEECMAEVEVELERPETVVLVEAVLVEEPQLEAVALGLF
jgi:hypothetical protein